MKTSEFIRNLIELAREAELETLDPEGLICHVLMTNMNAEKDLKRELLKTKEMTARNFTKIIDNYEAELIQISETSGAKANVVGAGEPPKDGQEELTHRCFRCNETGHNKADCTSRSKECKKESHSTAACRRNLKRSPSRGRWGSRQGERPQTPGGRRPRDQHKERRTTSKELIDLKKKYTQASAKYVKEKEQDLNSELIYTSGDEEEHEKEETRNRQTRRVVVCRNTKAHLSEDTPRLIMETRKRRLIKGCRSFKMKFIPDTGASI